MGRRTFFGITKREVDRFRDTVRAAFGDDQIRRRVTYRSKGARTFSATAGTYTSTDIDVAVWAVRTSIDEKRRGIHQEGDHAYFIEGFELTSRGITPKTDDFIVDGDELPIVEITHGPNQTFFRFIVKGK